MGFGGGPGWGGTSGGTGGGSSGVTSFNTRTGAVVLSAADVEALFTANNQIFLGSGSGTGALVDATELFDATYLYLHQFVR